MEIHHICPICREPIEAQKYREHLKAHGKRRPISADLTKLERILNDVKKAFENRKGNALFLSFEMARRAFTETEKVDTSLWNHCFDYEIPEITSQVHVRVPSKYPPIMCHIKFKVKDKKLFDELCKKYQGTEKETILKEMVSHNIPVIVVFRKNWANQVLQWKSEGMSSADIEMLTVYFFLHEMYHVLGFGEKDSTIKASMIMSQIFGQTVGIPEHEIERWKYEEKLKRGEKVL